MRVMLTMNASRESENGIIPSQQLLTDMMAFKEELVQAGIILTGEGLQAGSGLPG